MSHFSELNFKGDEATCLEELNLWGVSHTKHLCDAAIDALNEDATKRALALIYTVIDRLEEMDTALNRWMNEAMEEGVINDPKDRLAEALDRAEMLESIMENEPKINETGTRRG